MERRYQVFISSTYEDLQEERRAVSDTLLSLDCIPVGMEGFPAADEEQLSFIKKIIDESDYYILIIGGRYGSLCEDGLSFTEKEFDYAVATKKTIISFIRADREKLPCDKTDNDNNKKKKLELFIEKTSKGRLKKDWHNKDELKYLVSQSISYAKKTSPAVGYIRADVGDVECLLNQINELRLENEKLKSELSENNKDVVIISDVAEIDEEYEFKGINRKNNENEEEIKLTDTWINLFLQLAPSAMEGIDDNSAIKILSTYFAKKNNLKSFILDKNSFDIIKIQLIAVGMFDSDGFWQLTEKGKKHLLISSAIRTKKNLQK